MDYKMIHNYKDDIIADLTELVAIPSVAHNEQGEYPFGEQSARALHYILEKASSMGFAVKNIDNAAGYAEMGEGENYAGVLTHVDVVPAGDGWDTDPFTLTLRDGYLYGRGVADDKGAAVVALYCMKALKDAGITGNRRLRCIFGGGEEIGMDDMDIFFSKEPLPEMAFTPDSGYTVCNREKGIIHIHLGCDISADTPIVRMNAGTAINCVAEKTEVVIRCSEEQAEDIRKLVSEDGCACSYTADGDRFIINAAGRSAHAMQPHKGLNSAASILRAVDKVMGEDGVISTIVKMCCNDITGDGLGVAHSDEPSGALTMNLGNLTIADGNAVIGIDIRYPVTSGGGEIIDKIKAVAEENGMDMLDFSDTAPIYMPEDAPLIRALCQCYEQVTGEKANIYATGGGTYARALKGNGVAFGMEFDSEPPTKLHEANENFGVDALMRHAEICLAAMHRMMIM